MSAFHRAILLAVALTMGVGAADGGRFEVQLHQARLEPVIARAERPSRIIAILENKGSRLDKPTIELVAPDGVQSVQPSLGFSDWKKGEKKIVTWEVQAAAPLQGQAQVVVRQDGVARASYDVPVRWHAAVPVEPLDHVPAPQPVDTARYLVGAVHCPLWDGGHRWGDIARFPEREPALGFYDEGDPEVTDWEIKWALDHGISFFMVCWYRAKDGLQPVKPALGHWLHNGLFRSRYGDQVKFAIMFENGNKAFPGHTSERDLLDNLLPFWIENYFSRSNYLALEGKPVFSFYDVARLVENLGGETRTRAVLEQMRAACRNAGFQGLHILGQYCWGAPDELREQGERIRRLGMDASWAYHWPTFAGAFGEELRPSGARAIAAQEQLWRAQPQPNLVTLSMGWDSQPWRFSYSRTQWRLTPEEYRTLAGRAKSLLDQRQSEGIENRLVLLDNWNEFGEGHYILPHREHGFGYLEAVRDVFAPGAPPAVNRVPEDIGRGPYDTHYRARQKSNLARN